ncbi:TPA: hypothetical protein SMI16_002271 [Serratia liquefaciens]|nr:hypothetical protein [Serratia liquefaciens]
MTKRFNPDFSLSISHELAYMRETPEGGYVAHGDYATLFSELESVKAERDALERQLSMSEAKCKGYFSDAAAALVRCDALAVENAAIKEIIHPIANQNTDVECTDRPVWYVCDPRQMMSPTASSLCHMFHGPFWSRERAEEFLENTSYRYGNKAQVFCKSLYHYPEMRKLFDASKNLATPATSAALADIETRVWAEAKDLAKSMLATDSADHIDFLFDGKIKQLREAK